MKIVGICLVRNEEHFISWALGNVVDFCDEILVLDNKSTDGTREILDRFAERHPHVRVITVEEAYDTHRFVEPYADTKTWVFGVDGDEIYDPKGLALLRDDLIAGRYDGWWRLDSQTLHVTRVDLAASMASGYLAPPSRPMTKLYNFAAMKSWHQRRHERLHGKNIVFHDGFAMERSCRDFLTESWDTSRLKCLHLCFMPRSGLDTSDGRGRRNPVEEKRAGRIWSQLAPLIGLSAKRDTYKQSFYAVGPVASVAIDQFQAPPHAESIALLSKFNG